jgi:hypothetical protein
VSKSSSDPGTTATEMGRTLPATPSGIAAVGPPPAEASLLASRRLAHFRLEKPLGAGGMGEVWLATDLALERHVAVKLLSRDLSADPSLRERFYREARAQARILHPNVGHIYYIGEDDGQLFFAMELIEGESLAQRLARLGRLPATEALDLCRQAALGLREAHRHGFTHRDVKPSNLMLDRHGAVKLVDFGLVKQESKAENVALTLETGGGVMGTPLYMAPEQARCDAVDFRTDIYALGATLHHFVTGEPPFTGKTSMQVVSKHLSEPRPHVPAVRKQNPALDPLLDRMMAKEPEGRFASYDDLLVAIEQAAPGDTRPAGFFVRGAALLLDFFLVMVSMLPLSGLLPEPSGNIAFCVFLAAYAIAVPVRFGRTVGKWLLEIEIAPEGRKGRLTWKASAQRFLAQWGLLFLGVGALEMMQVAWTGSQTGEVVGIVAAVSAMLLPLLGGAIASVFRPDRRAYWDRFAGTRVRYRPKA